MENNITDKEINEYNKWIHEEYCENFVFDNEDKTFQLIETHNIPIELLSKYYINMYSIGGKFCESLKKDLSITGPLKSNFYKYIKILYISNKSKNSFDKNLYHALKIEDYEIQKIKNLPKVYARRFLSFSSDKGVVENHKENRGYNAIITLNYNNKICQLLKTYAEIENISQLKEEKEVLFFPFSLFKIISINQKLNEDKKEYEITVEYLDINNEKPKKEEKKGYKIKGKSKLKRPSSSKISGANGSEFRTKLLLFIGIFILVLSCISYAFIFKRKK